MDRRRFLGLGLLAAAAAPTGCLRGPTDVEPAREAGRLGVPWHPPTTELGPGLHALGLRLHRDGFIRVPAGYRHASGAPLALLLHGAGGSAEDWATAFGLFDELGMVALGVSSEGASWDLRYGEFGPDAHFVGMALERAFQGVRVDRTRLAISGFSDGASYALSLGLINGDLFSHVLGFSPGYAVLDPRHGRPRVFLAHGTGDNVLPVAFTRRLADGLRADGHEVRYEEFAGGHVVPMAVARRSYGWVAE